MNAVVGRDDALEQIERFLAEARHRYVALVLEGEPGIGKTTVWREGVRRGEKDGFRILACRPAQAEAKLAFAALADLLGAVEEDDLTGPAHPLPALHARPGRRRAFCVFDAESPAVVEQAYARAGVPCERVLDALEIPLNRDAPSATPAAERSIDVSKD
jgi:hypothetical protein